MTIYTFNTEQWDGPSEAHLIHLKGRNNSHVISVTVTAQVNL